MQQEKFNCCDRKSNIKESLEMLLKKEKIGNVENKNARHSEKNAKEHCLSEREIAKKIANYNRYLILRK